MHPVRICLCPGSMHNARVLRLSNLFSQAELKNILTLPYMDVNEHKFNPKFYPLKSWLMPPLQDNGALTPAQRRFNKELSKVCIVVEHGFGQTEARWRCLDKRIDDDTTKIPLTITTYCVLHNICVLMQDSYDREAVNNHCGQHVLHGEDEVGAKDIRQAIVDYLY